MARAFNETLTRLEHAGAKCVFSTALAHELRTPLAAVRRSRYRSFGSNKPDAETQNAEI